MRKWGSELSPEEFLHELRAENTIISSRPAAVAEASMAIEPVH
jgi:hypothetical protein